MTAAQKLLLETLTGHFALLESAYPKKARTQTAKKARQYVQMKLRQCNSRQRLAA